MLSTPKLCHFINLDGPGGGPQTVIAQLIELNKSFDLYVLHGGSGIIAKLCDDLNIPHWRVATHKKRYLIWGLFQVTKHLRRIRPDCLVLHGQTAGPIGALAGKLACVPHMLYITQFPSFYTDRDLYRINRNYFAEAIPCRLVDYTVCPSRGNYYQYLLRHWGDERKLLVINNSFNPARVPAPEAGLALRAVHGWDEKICHVVSVGRIDDQKRIDWLLNSWKLIVARELPAHLWIIGGGRDESRMRALATELGLSAACTFLGPQPNGIDFIAASDFVVMTSLYEGHANLPLEAMGCGKAIVASDVDGVGDSFTENSQEGFLVPPADIAGFASRIETLILNKGLRDRMGAQGKERVKAFTPQIKIGELQSLIEKLLENNL
jgi:glycosyltransferase involved in cell wall biosynthesis